METISIIVTVYNAADYIEQTVNQVRNQTFTDWELILVEDCSKDNTKGVLNDVIDKLQDNRIHVIYKEHNEGAAKARNTGLEHAVGRYIAFLDADDIWLPQKLEKELAFMKEKNAGFVFSSYEFGDEDGIGTGKIVRVPKTITYKQALSRTVIFTTTVLFDTQIVSKELIRMPDIPSEDTATWWKILRTGYTAYGMDEVMVWYRRPAKSLSSNKMEAIRRVWNLYRKVEGLSLCYSAYNFIFYAVRTTRRRI